MPTQYGTGGYTNQKFLLADVNIFDEIKIGI